MDAHTTVPEVAPPFPIESICQMNAAPVTIASTASTRCSPGDESVPELIISQAPPTASSVPSTMPPMVRTRCAAAKAAGSESGKLVCGWFFIRKQTTASTTAAMTIISATAYGQMLPRTARPVSASKQT